MPPASILVAEDQTDIRDLLVMNLRGAGYEVEAVADGTAALASQAERASDLLVLDLMMPGLDGLEVTKALRARGRSTPILMLTAKSTELDRVLGLEHVVDGVFGEHGIAQLLHREPDQVGPVGDQLDQGDRHGVARHAREIGPLHGWQAARGRGAGSLGGVHAKTRWNR